MATVTSLWPKDIQIKTAKAPVAVLREQAKALGEMTNYSIHGEVIPHPIEEGTFFYTFNIACPSLGNYRYSLLSIQHDINLYPVQITTSEDIYQEIQNNKEIDSTSYKEIFASSEDELLIILETIFKSEKTKHVIASLLSQVESGALW